MVYIAINEETKKTIYANKVDYNDKKKRDKTFICVDCPMVSYLHAVHVNTELIGAFGAYFSLYRFASQKQNNK